VADCLPWLQQGDVFEDVPWFRPILSGTALTVPRESGAALLITENCQLDKRTRRNQPRKDQRLQFLPLRALSTLADDSQTRVLAGDINPPEPIYVGEIDGEHVFGRLGEAYSFPIQFMRAAVSDFTSDPRADRTDPWHLAVPEADWPRIMTMDAEWISIMHQKMWLFWTREKPIDPPDGA
jgi:hypothetical protein